MNDTVHVLASLFTVAAGVAIVAVLVSNNAQSSGVISALFSGFGTVLTAAEGPVSSSSGSNSQGVA